jgi:hypothetical protein
MVSRRRRRDETRFPAHTASAAPEVPEKLTLAEGTQMIADRLIEHFQPADRERVLALIAPLVVVGNSIHEHHRPLAELLFQAADMALTEPETALETAAILEARIEDVRALLREDEDDG